MAVQMWFETTTGDFVSSESPRTRAQHCRDQKLLRPSCPVFPNGILKSRSLKKYMALKSGLKRKLKGILDQGVSLRVEHQ